MRFVLLVNKYGDLGNRLFRFARLYHQTSGLGIILIDLSFYQYVWHFKPKPFFYRFIFFLQKIVGEKIFHFFTKIFNVEFKNRYLANVEMQAHVCLTQVADILRKNSALITLLKCSEFRCGDCDLSDKQKKHLSEIYFIDPRYQKKACKILGPNRREYVFVGVHIRHGDFREFAEGKFYLETAEYVKKLKILKDTYKYEKKLLFAIVSNEKIDPILFDGLNFVLGSFDNPIIDLSILHQCDYIISTFSSFSGWSSFVNKTPRIVLKRNKIPSWEQLHLCKLNFWETA